MKYKEIRLSIAKKIKELREKQGINQRELAKRAGVSQKTISNLENINALNETCNLDKLAAVATALKVEINYLLKEDSNTANNTETPSKEALEFAKAFDELPPEQQALLEAFIHSSQKPAKKVA